MSINLMSEERKAPAYTLELSAETYEELSGALQGIRAVTASIKAIIPPHFTERLEACLAKSMGAIGMIAVVREEERSPTLEEIELEQAEARYDSRVQGGLDISPTLAEVNARRGYPEEKKA
jgi:hypothetical protein